MLLLIGSSSAKRILNLQIPDTPPMLHVLGVQDRTVCLLRRRNDECVEPGELMLRLDVQSL
jgi:hypothetical protein